MRPPLWAKRQIEQLKDMYESGVTVGTIAAELERTQSAVKTRAQIEGLRRPKRFGAREIAALHMQAVACGLDEAHLPANPTALRILVRLANFDISAKHDLDQLCSMGHSARNKAIAILRSCGLVMVDNFSSPSEIILTRRAYRSRPKPGFVDLAAVRNGILPTMNELIDSLDAWVSASCCNPASVGRYREFIIRQLLNAQSGDITTDAFFSIFFDPKAKSKEG